MQIEYKQGMEANEQGLFLSNNPYSWDTQPVEQARWRDGWIKQQEIREEWEAL